MQLTRAADYAVRVMIHLASQPRGSSCLQNILAKAAEAPESFLSKILQTLARAGLIQARRGVAGGFSLLAAARKLLYSMLMESIDGPVALNVCLTSGSPVIVSRSAPRTRFGCGRSRQCCRFCVSKNRGNDSRTILS